MAKPRPYRVKYDLIDIIEAGIRSVMSDLAVFGGEVGPGFSLSSWDNEELSIGRWKVTGTELAPHPTNEVFVEFSFLPQGDSE